MCSSPSPSKTESATCSSAWPSPLPWTSPLSEWTCISQLGRTASSLSARSFDCGVFASSSAWRIDAPVEFLGASGVERGDQAEEEAVGVGTDDDDAKNDLIL